MAETESTDSTGSDSAAVERTNAQANSLVEAIAKMRDRNDITAKALGGIGTAAVAGIGYAELADLFPVVGECGTVAGIGLVGGVLLMALSVLMVMQRFEGAAKSVITTADLGETWEANKLNPGSKAAKEIELAYDQAARLNGAPSLGALEARRFRFERIAERTPDDELAAKLRARAELIDADVGAAQARAGAFVVRRRTREGLFSCRTVVWIMLFVTGLYGSAVAADKLASNRADETAKEGKAGLKDSELVEFELAKRCGEVDGDKVAASLIPKACKPGGEIAKAAEEEKVTALDLVDEAYKSLAAGVGECAQVARKGGEAATVCQRLERAFDAARPGAEAAPAP